MFFTTCRTLVSDEITFFYLDEPFADLFFERCYGYVFFSRIEFLEIFDFGDYVFYGRLELDITNRCMINSLHSVLSLNHETSWQSQDNVFLSFSNTLYTI